MSNQGNYNGNVSNNGRRSIGGETTVIMEIIITIITIRGIMLGTI